MEMCQPNGRSFLDVSEDEVTPTVRKDNIKQPVDTEKKNEKSKKKKKSKGDAKTVQDTSRLDGKEVDEGAWETKISNREKRQQRKRDKVLTDSGSGESNLHGLENAVTVSIEQLMPAPALPVGLRKNKGDALLNAQISSSKPPKGESSIPQAAWNVDARINTSEQNSTSFSSFGLTPGVSGSNSESVSQTGTSDFQWDLSHAQPPVDDEWSGLNGLSSADPSSDWNAPAEEWGNWVDDEKVVSVPQREERSDIQKISDNEKAEPILQSSASGKSKKKKKKKKKQGEEANSPAQDTEELDREAGEEFQKDTSKVQPQQERAFSVKTISTSEPAKSEEPPSLAVSTEPSVIVSESNSDKITSQVPQMLQETDVSSPSIKQNSVPPPQKAVLTKAAMDQNHYSLFFITVSLAVLTYIANEQGRALSYVCK
ncbi:Protein LYRIC [Willisornis vidua]|uniref:Protein LYRIC n=1 Tax=Willisornis vidua TaxID=1566151 RepID=A0ABQ9D735_9PASS|nr:Protein LYRIC [Willisornis vidua]